MTDRLLSFLGICRRAGSVAIGHDAVKDAIRSSKAKLVLMASDASPRLEKEFSNLGSSVEIIRLDRSMDDICKYIGKRAGVLAVTDGNMASAVIKKYEEGMKYGN